MAQSRKKRARQRQARHRNKAGRLRNQQLKKLEGLVPIDDQPLRKEAFQSSQKLLKKIDRMEKQIHDFNTHDQELFNDWYNLTFRSEIQNLEGLRDRYQELGELHNDVLATCDMLDIDIGKAYAEVLAERKAYENGSAAERAKIDQKRQRREEYIEEQIRKEYAFANDPFDDFDDYLDESGTDVPSQLFDISEMVLFPDAPPRSEEDVAALEMLKMTSKTELRRSCSTFTGAFEILGVAVTTARTVGDFEFVLMLWELIPGPVQNKLDKSFKSSHRMSIKKALASFRGMLDDAYEFARNEFPAQDDGDWAEEKADFVRNSRRPNQYLQSDPETEEKVKLIFRKLIRRLHPDLSGSGATRHTDIWQERVWAQAQQAKNSNNLKWIDHLFKQTLIREKTLDELTLSEIYESQDWLENELTSRKLEIRSLKRHRWWGFSRKRSYKALTLRIQKEFDRNQRDLKDQLDELEMIHEHWARLAENNSRRPSKKRRDPKKRQVEQQTEI